MILRRLADPREFADWMRFGLILGGVQCCVTVPAVFREEVTCEGRRVAFQRLHGRVSQKWLWTCGLLAMIAQALHWAGVTPVPRDILVALVRTTSGSVFDWRDALRYALLGIGLEGFFTSLADRKPAGHSSPWYTPLYVLAPMWMALVYPGTEGLELAPWWFRGLAGMSFIVTVEFLSMGFLRMINGDSPSGREYRMEGDSLFGWGLVRRGLLPVWFCASFFFEFSRLAQQDRLPTFHMWWP